MTYIRTISLALASVSILSLTVLAKGDSKSCPGKGSSDDGRVSLKCNLLSTLPPPMLQLLEIESLTKTKPFLRQLGAAAGLGSGVADINYAVTCNTGSNMQKALCAAQPLLVNTVWRTITDRLPTWTHAQDAAELIENMSVEELQELRSMRNKQRIMWLIDALMRAGEISFGKRHNHSILNAIKGVRLLFAIYRDYDLHEAFDHLNSQVMPAS